MSRPDVKLIPRTKTVCGQDLDFLHFKARHQNAQQRMKEDGSLLESLRDATVPPFF